MDKIQEMIIPAMMMFFAVFAAELAKRVSNWLITSAKNKAKQNANKYLPSILIFGFIIAYYLLVLSSFISKQPATKMDILEAAISVSMLWFAIPQLKDSYKSFKEEKASRL